MSSFSAVLCCLDFSQLLSGDIWQFPLLTAASWTNCAGSCLTRNVISGCLLRWWTANRTVFVRLSETFHNSKKNVCIFCMHTVRVGARIQEKCTDKFELTGGPGVKISHFQRKWRREQRWICGTLWHLKNKRRAVVIDVAILQDGNVQRKEHQKLKERVERGSRRLQE